LEGQRWLSGGTFQPWANAANGMQSRAADSNVLFILSLLLVEKIILFPDAQA
jgi:hypothetical protein